MQWASYIAAQTIMSDGDIRIEVFNILNGREAIPFEELIGRNTSSNTLFRAKFIDILNLLIDSTRSVGPGPTTGMETPPPPVIDCGCGAPTEETEFFVNLFFQALLIENCVELYMPEGFSPFTPISVPHSITSTSHPLSTESFNKGIIHYSEPIFNGSFDVTSEGVDVVDSNYVANTNNDIVIVVRPFRPNTISLYDPCTYEEFSNIDFTDFLSN